MCAIRLIFGALQSSFPRTFCYVSESMGILRSLNLLALVGLVTLIIGANATAKAFPTLDSSVDPELQQALDASLQKLGLGDAVANKHLAVSLVDITNPYYPRMAEVNAANAGHEFVANSGLAQDFLHDRARLWRHKSVRREHVVKA